jgi:ribosomal protein L6P/L9E
MKDISSVESLTIPEGVTVAIKSRIVTVEGPRGKLVKNVGHVQMDIQLVSGFTKGITVKRRKMDFVIELAEATRTAGTKQLEMSQCWLARIQE